MQTSTPLRASVSVRISAPRSTLIGGTSINVSSFVVPGSSKVENRAIEGSISLDGNQDGLNTNAMGSIVNGEVSHSPIVPEPQRQRGMVVLKKYFPVIRIEPPISIHDNENDANTKSLKLRYNARRSCSMYGLKVLTPNDMEHPNLQPQRLNEISLGGATKEFGKFSMDGTDLKELSSVLLSSSLDQPAVFANKISQFFLKANRSSEYFIFRMLAVLLSNPIGVVDPVVDVLLGGFSSDDFLDLFKKNSRVLGEPVSDAFDNFLRGDTSGLVSKLSQQGIRNPLLSCCVGSILGCRSSDQEIQKSLTKYVAGKKGSAAQIMSMLSGRNFDLVEMKRPDSWKAQLALCMQGWTNRTDNQVLGGISKFLKHANKKSPVDLINQHSLPGATCMGLVNNNTEVPTRNEENGNLDSLSRDQMRRSLPNKYKMHVEPFEMTKEFVPFLVYLILNGKPKYINELHLLLHSRRFSSHDLDFVTPFLLGVLFLRLLPGNADTGVIAARVDFLARGIVENLVGDERQKPELSTLAPFLANMNPVCMRAFVRKRGHRFLDDIKNNEEYKILYMELKNHIIYSQAIERLAHGEEEAAVSHLVGIGELNLASRILMRCNNLQSLLLTCEYAEAFELINKLIGLENLKVMREGEMLQMSSVIPYDIKHLINLVEHLEFLLGIKKVVERDTINWLLDSGSLPKDVRESIIDQIVIRLTSSSTCSSIVQLLENKEVLRPFEKGFECLGNAMLGAMLE